MKKFYKLILCVFLGGIATEYSFAQTLGCGITASCNFTTTPVIGKTNIGCFGDSTGQLDLIYYSSGTNYPYCFEWHIGTEFGDILDSGTVAGSGVGNPPNPVGSGTITNLPAGTYVLVTYNDAIPNCKNKSTQIIEQPTSVFTAALSSTSPPSCAGTCLNTATADGSGGTPPYNFSWSTFVENGVFSSTSDSLCTGNYSVTITDDAGCDTLLDFYIDISPLPLADAGPDNLLCNGSPGVTIGGSPTATGGTAPFTYTWTPNGGTLNFDNVSNPVATPPATTTYTVVVTDTNNCTGTDDMIVNVNPTIDITFSIIVNVSCFGDSSGMAVASASGGSSPFSFLWNTPPPQANDTAANLPVGTYIVTITDDSACTAMDSVTIVQPALLTANITTSAISCNGINDGSATAVPGGGTNPYTYLWSPGGQTTQTINSLSPGNYCVTITDSKGCDSSVCAIFVNPPAIIPNFLKTNVTCNGLCDGKASVAPTGGTSPYSVIWNPGAFSTALSVTGLCPGNYSVTVFDDAGCNKTTPFTITQPGAIIPNSSATSVSCSGICDGQVTANPTGGTTPYSYNWSVPSVLKTVTGLCSGTYQLTVTDSMGCSKVDSATISTPSAVSVNLSVLDATCPDYFNGSAVVAPTGGVSPYTMVWSDFSTTQPFDSLGAGSYSVTVTDFTGCSASQNFSITAPAVFVTNPSQTDPSCYGSNNGNACVSPTGGTSPYSYSWSCSGSIATCANGLSAGPCTVTITDFNSCTKTESFTLIEPDSITTLTSQLNQTCSGFCDGVGDVSPVGGIAPYTYLWSAGGQTDPTATGLCGGINTVTVTDDNNCTAVDTVIISSSVVITITSTIVNEDCNAIGCDGSATATASGGFGPYDFVWSNGDIANDTNLSMADSLCAQSYSITATDALGCSSIDSLVMTVADSVLQITDSVINVSCTGNNDGQAFALVSGGTGSGTYSYTWSPGGETDSLLTGLAPGTYSVLVIDGNLCRDSLAMDVAEPSVLTASATWNDLSCNSSCTGTATASQLGGTPPYFYVWSDGQTTQTATGLCADTFSVIVYDANSCSSVAEVILSQPAALSAVMSSSPVSCNAGNNGTATATPAGGTSPYTYVWSVPLQTSPTITGLSAATYFVTVTDANSCTFTSSVSVSQPSALSVSVSKTDLFCNGICTGTATANPSGGTSPYTYLWSDGQLTLAATGLCAGTFTVTVTDFNGCPKTASITIAEPTELTISISKTNVTCNGLCNGSAIATTSGGNSPYSYLWSNGQSSSTATGLCSGTFVVTATDSNNCSDTMSVFISQPLAISAIPNPSSSNCGICDGVAKFTLTGGTPGYTHSWNNGSSSYPLTFVCAAIYTDTITDNNGCQLIASVAVSNLNAPDGATIISNNASCYGSCNGNAAIVAVSGGTPPFSYLWDDGETDTVMTDICAGSNILKITDDLGCIHFETFVIDEPDSLQAAILVSSATCSGLSDGTAIANPSGGTPSYSFLWGTGSSASTISEIASGSYPLTITDASGCFVVDTATVGESTILSLLLSESDVLCNGEATGSMQATVSGGTPPYSYSWNNGQATSSSTGLISGNYFVTITDINGCSVAGNDTINESPAVSVSPSVTNATCGLSDGSVTVVASGGNSPYSYVWLNGQGSATATGLAAGTESVIVTDANSCIDTFDIGVNNINGPGTSASVTNVTCFGVCDGTGNINVTSGVSPFTYLWVPGGQATSSVSGLCGGDFNVQVTDGNNCTTVQSVTVSEPAPVSASFSKTQTSCHGICDGTTTVTASGGVIPYSYLWNNLATTQFISGLCAGTYTVTITDGNGCAGTGSVTISEPALLSATATGSVVSCFGDCNGTAMVAPSGGTPGYSYEWSSGASTSNAASLCEGNYDITVTDAKGCTAIASTSVTQPGAISISAIVISTTCGNCSGTIAVSASGGISPYSRLWSTGSVAASVSNLCPNIYDLSVTDASGCSTDTSFIINNSDGPLPVLTGDTTNCFNSCDASASSSTSGGTSPYTFLWDDPSSQTNSTATGLCDGTYALYATDLTGCIGIGTTTIEEPTQLSSTFSVVDSDCNSSCDVTVTTVPSGGISPYSFAWSGGLGTNPSISNVCSGTYFVTITDNNSCIRIDSVVVDEASTLAITLAGTNSNCFNSCDGIVSSSASGGTTPYSFSWSNSETTPVITNLCSGTFLLTITDNKGCEKVDSATITEPSLLDVSISSTDNNCYSGNDGTTTVSMSGGTSPYSYNWSPSGQTNSSATGLFAGTHSVTVSDANGCTIDALIVIGQPPVLTSDSIFTTNTACGDTSGFATIFVSGGATPYSYLWSNGDTTQTADSLLQGAHSVTITYNGTCDTAFGSILIVNTDAPNVVMDSTDALCGGSCNGEATAHVSVGNTPYSYSWGNGQSDSTATGLCAGIYFLTVTDWLGCLTISSVTISEPAIIVLDSIHSDISCFGANDGSASVSPSGGISPYAFLWSNGSNSASITGLSPGTYCVTVTDANGCDPSACVTIVEPAVLSLLTSFNNATCNGFCNGDASVVVSGGSSPFFYLWSNGDTGSSGDSLCTGNPTVTITDINGCTIDTSFVISEPSFISASFTQTQPNCADSNGAVTVNVLGGTPFSAGIPYSYTWNNSQTDSTATGLTAGSYTVTVTDSMSCSSVFATSVSSINGPVVVFDSVDSVSCFGLCDGIIFITSSGVNVPFSFAWNTGQTTEDVTNLCAGNYLLSVTDTSGCISIVDTIISQPDLLSASISSTVGTCGICNSSATANVSGGTGSYNFAWGNTQTSVTATSLCAGADSVLVTDENGCSTTANTTIMNLSGPTGITLTSSDINCFGVCSGTASVAAIGGTAPFSYLWSSGLTDSSATGLCAGSETISITDSTGCTIDTVLTVNQPSDISADSIVVVDAACIGANGSISAYVSGGTSPFNYSWSNSQTNYNDTGLVAGIYSLSITDGNGCLKIFSGITVENSNGPAVTTSGTDVSCYGICSGSISASIGGGISPFTYLWSNGDTSSTADSLCSGNYSVSVTDALGCVSIVSDTVNEPALLTALATGTDVLCNGANTGTASAAGGGGTTPYSFLWNNASTSPSISNLPAGNYCVTVSDAQGCSMDTCVLVSEPSAVSLVLSSGSVTCFGFCDGNANASVSGGVSPYSYLWNSGETDSSAIALCAGTDSIFVTDANGCLTDSAVVISTPDDIVADSIVIVKASCLMANGSITIFASGGNAPLAYQWSNGDTGILSDSLLLGVYSVEITDSLACTKTFDNIIVNNINGPSITTTVSDPLCNGNCNGQITAVASGGIPPYGFAWSTGDSSVFVVSSTTDSLCAGVYFVTVVDVSICGTIVFGPVTDPALLTASVSSNDISCNGANDGTASASGNGGTSPYAFLWSNGDTTSSTDSLAPGSYCVTITDANGCDSSVCVSISEPALLSVIFSSNNLSCNSSCDGNATATVSGGTPPYSILWSNGDNTTIADSLCAAFYTVSITDLKGCSLTDSVNITEPNAIISDSVLSVSPFCGDSTGTATVFPSGGVSPYSYLWNTAANNQVTQTATGLKAGVYSVTVSDNTGCNQAFSVNVSNIGAQTVGVSVTDVSCGGYCDGMAKANVTGGTTPYSFLWSTSSTTDTINNLCPGIISVTVTDSASCVVYVTDSVEAGNILAGTIGVTDVLCNGDSTGSIFVSVTGGTTPYSYTWSNGQTGFGANGLSGGVYCVTVTDTGGCIFLGCDTVFQPDSALIVMTSSTGASCFGSCDGGASAMVSGGISPYNYNWCNGSTAPSILSCAMTCIVTVTDANGCSSSGTATIPEPTAFTVIDSLTPPACGSTSGTISVSVSGGTPSSSGYSYLWGANANNQTTATATGLAIGTYCITVTDSIGCTFDSCYSLITSGNAVVSVDSILTPKCYGACEGKIIISVTGNAPFSYLWSNGDLVKDPDSLCAGTYFLTITDSLGCVSSFDTSVTEPPAINASLTMVDAACGICDGTANISASGGTSPYSFQWSNNDTGVFADSLCAGNYVVSVSDANGCPAGFTASVSNFGGPDSVTLSSANLSCFGSCDGSASATVFGGTPPFSYLWSSGENTSSLSDLCAGNYSLSVTDSSGCLSVVAANISQPFLMSAVFSTVPPGCGVPDGSVSIAVLGGTPSDTGYYYQWSNNVPGSQISATVTGLGTGIFNVTVTDSLGCSGIFGTTLSNSNAMVFATSFNASCFGKCDGSIITDSVTGTYFPLSYVWIPSGQTDSSISSLCAGSYTLEITDALNCQAFQDFVIAEPGQMAATFGISEASCGQCNGQAIVTVSGGSTPYNYLWTNNQTDSTATGLCAGVYSAEIIDGNGCPGTFNTGISNFDAPSDTADITNASCFGQCDGAATVTASGGVTPYSYFWVGSSPPNFTNSATDLCAGNYFVQITGGNGCVHTNEIIISQPAGLSDSSLISMPTCNGTNGSVNAIISGGTSPYNYLWSTGSATPLVSGLSAGIYLLTLTDNGGSGCSQVFPYILNSDSAPSLSITGNNTSCHAVCDGQATVNATGGVTAYSYQWFYSNLNPIAGQTSSTVNSLCAGSYFAQVTDATLCLSSIQIEIEEPAPLDTSLMFSTGNLCYGDCNGSATAVISGGSLPYSYLWNDGNGQVTNIATGLCAGNYSVSVNDANGCSVFQSVTINQPTQISADTNSVSSALCFDSNNGAIDLSPGGGTSPYTYNWSGPNSFSSTLEDVSGLLPGYYYVTVTDINSCDTSVIITVDTTISLILSPLPDTMICEGAGGITYFGNTSGNGSVGYSWVEISTGNTISNDTVVLISPSAGTTQYYLSASIGGFCEVRDTFQITVNQAPAVDAGSGSTVVKGVTASVGGAPTASEGTPPYSYSWMPIEGLDDPSLSNPTALPGQTTWYTVTVTTADGCTATDSVDVTVVPLIEFISGFTPNGDGVNETWEIDYVEQFPSIVVEIYNRWGQLLFHSVGYKDPWNGTFNGKPLPIGTYYYVIVLNHPKFPDPITGPVTIVK